MITRVIVALRSDPGLPARTTLQWEGFFADAIDRAMFDLRRLNGLVSREQAIWAIEDFFIARELSAPQASAGA